MNAPVAIVILLIAAVAGITVAMSIDFVQAGERGVTTHWGGVNLDESPRHEGLNWKTPFQDNIVHINVQTQKYPKVPETISPDAGDDQPRGIRIAGTSKDVQDVFTEGVAIYHLNGDMVTHLFKNIGTDYRSEIIEPLFKQIAKQTMAEYTAVEQVQKREQLKDNIKERLAHALINLDQCKNCIILEDIAITDLDFSPEFSAAIERKQVAEEDAKTQYNLVEEKKAIAEQARQTAQGQADAKAIEAEGEARYIQTINDAIENNPGFLEWYKIARWSGNLPLVVGEDNIPLVNIPMK